MSFHQMAYPSTSIPMDYYNPSTDLQINDVLDVINEDTKLSIQHNVPPQNPYLQIIEQPASKALRFRYECEGRSAGSIPGLKSTPENKTYPSIMVHNYVGKVALVISCVTKDPPYRPHPHKITTKDNSRNGIIYTHINAGEVVPLTNLGIQCVKKKEVVQSLKEREDMNVDPFNTGFNHKNRATDIDLNAVRLAFQVFVKKDKKPLPIEPIVSDVIYDKKAMCELVIDKLSHYSASVAGGTEMILLCEKVNKDDIEVRFFEEVNGQLKWEGFGEFQANSVHKQVAIAFRTPRYMDQEIDDPVQVFIELRRPSDKAVSSAIPFEMTPIGKGRSSFLFSKKSFNKFSTQEPATNGLPCDELKNINGKISALRALNKLYSSSTAKSLEHLKLQDSESIENNNNSPISNGTANKTEVVEEIVIDESNDNLPTAENTENLNELLTEVAEIYADTSAKLARERLFNKVEHIDVHDNQTYSSLQMAMKNPLELILQDKHEKLTRSTPSPPPLVAKRDVLEEKVPPLPPKRIRKMPSMPVLPRPASINDDVPKKPLPNPTKQTMQSLFAKLFKKVKKEKELTESVSLDKESDNILAGDKTPPYGFDLTEAENYALYTDMAPHATVSEFDEMSFYYSPVENGKILINEEKREI